MLPASLFRTLNMLITDVFYFTFNNFGDTSLSDACSVPSKCEFCVFPLAAYCVSSWRAQIIDDMGIKAVSCKSPRCDDSVFGVKAGCLVVHLSTLVNMWF